MSFKETYERCLQFGRGLATLGVKKGDNLGIYAHNSIMWQTTAFGAYSISATVVPVYDSLGAEASEYIVNQADIKILFSSEFKFKNELKLLDILDALLFSKFRAALGGKLRLLISGGAPIMLEIFEFLSATITPNTLNWNFWEFQF